MKNKLAILLATICLTAQTWAVPTLQLDIEGGYYDSSTETVMAPGNPFTLNALISGGIQPDTGYFVSAAIVPKTTVPLTANFGSFTVNGVTYSAGNMIYGTPPADDPDFRPYEIGSHGIYDTHYAEIQFTPDANNRALEYNSRDNPGGLVVDANGTLIFENFVVDIRDLADGFAVHFDFYAVGEISKRGEIGTKITSVAPFSKDAQSQTRGVPDGGATAILLGAGFLGLAAVRRRS